MKTFAWQDSSREGRERDFEKPKSYAVAGDDVAGTARGFEVGNCVGIAKREAEKALTAAPGFAGEEDFRSTADEEGVFRLFGENGPQLFSRKGFRIGRGAKTSDRAGGASRGAGAANRLAEFHQGGVVESGGIFREEACGALPKKVFADGGVDGRRVVEKAGEDPGNVSIDQWHGEIEGETCHGVGGVGAEAGEFEEFGGVTGKRFPVEVASRFLEIADPIVVAEALPGAEDGRLGSGGEGGGSREFGEEFFKAPVRQNAGHRGLLQHQLGNKDRPRVRREPPRVGFADLGKPVGEGFTEGGGIGGGGHGRFRERRGDRKPDFAYSKLALRPDPTSDLHFRQLPFRTRPTHHDDALPS